MSSNQIISKVWSFCNTLRDDGVSYGDYLEQPTYLLFLEMTEELSKPPYNRSLPIPTAYNWESLTGKRGVKLEGHYTTLLREVGHQKGVLGQIFTKRFTRDHCKRQNFFRYYMAERQIAC